MKIKIIAPYKGATTSGMFDGQGQEVPIGTEIEVDEKTFDLPPNRYEVLSGSTADMAAVVNPAQTDNGAGSTPAGYVVKEKDKGWLVVTKDGEEVTKNFRKDDLDGFDAMSDEDKSAFVDLHKKDA